MTLQEAIEIMTTRDPSRIYCATKKVWTDRENSQYEIGMLPGADGEPCSIHAGDTIGDAVQRAMLAMPKPEFMDDNNE